MPRKGENIYKRKDGRWEGRYIKERNSDNKSKYGYVYAKTYTEVKKKLIECRTESNLNNSNKINVVTSCTKNIAYFSEKWLEEIKNYAKQSTYVKYSNILYNHIVPFWGNLKVSDVTTELLKKFVEEKQLNGNLKDGGPLSGKTIKDILSVLRLIFKSIQALGVEINCHFDALNLKFKAPDQKETLTNREQQKLTQYLLNDTDNIKLGMLICLYAGLRIGEVCAVRFGDISISDKVIHINKTMQRLQNLSESAEKKLAL